MIIPFFIPHSGCPHQCVFCDQRKITGENEPPDVEAISAKIVRYLKSSGDRHDASVAFYGGSFTALPLHVQKEYLSAAHAFIRNGLIRAMRISTRPDGLDVEKLSLLREHGVDTVEIGAQSMDDSVLALSGRGHTSSDTVKAVKLLRENGFTIGMQLMPGLPGDSADIFIATVDRTTALRPDFVRLYPALVIRGTPLERLFRSGRYIPLALDEAVSWCATAKKKFDLNGIGVVRMGLQPTEELEKDGTIAAGPYHPAFRQMVESSILLDEMRRLLAGIGGSEGAIVISANPRDISSAIGQKRANIAAIKKEFGIRRIHILPDDNVRRGMLSLIIEQRG